MLPSQLCNPFITISFPPHTYTHTHMYTYAHTYTQRAKEETMANRDNMLLENVKQFGGMQPGMAGWRKLKNECLERSWQGEAG